MDAAENDNDQPNSSSASASASASISPSSSNESSSSNLLRNLLPFLRSTDDDDREDDDVGVGHDNEMAYEESMPRAENADSVAGLAMRAPNPPSVEEGAYPLTPNEVAPPPMVRARRDASADDVSLPLAPPATALTESRRSLPLTLPTSTASPSHLMFPPPLVFNANPTDSSQSGPRADGANRRLDVIFDSAAPFSLPGQLVAPVPASHTLDTTLSPSPQALSLMSPSSFSSSSSSASTSSHQSYNLALHPEQIPTSSSTLSSFPPPQQPQDHQASPPPPLQAPQPPSSIAPSSSTPPREDQSAGQPLTRNAVADTIDASAIQVRSLQTSAVRPHQPEGEALPDHRPASEQPFGNDIQLDDNDNNEFDVDLNNRNEPLVANASTSPELASAERHQSPLVQQPQQSSPHLSESPPLDTSASGSAGTSGLIRPPSSLPLLLYQQPQPLLQHQHSEESKRSPPSYDHRYHHHHNSREYHSHSQHPYQYPYDFPSSLQQQRGSNGATGSSSHSSTMFGGSSSSSDRNNGSSTSGIDPSAGGSGGAAEIDRIKLLYPNVNENETPLPRCWSPHDKCLSIGLSQNNLRVHFKGKQNNDAASVRTAHPIPASCGIYYFEVKIISKGKNGYMGIGLTAQQFRMNRLPGWDKQSYGYHGDDGNSFSSSGHGQSYGPTFTTGDVIGCCINFVNNTCFYTKNGVDLGIAFRDLPPKLYPTVGLQTPGEEVDANFGQEPFKFVQIEEMIKQMRNETKTSINDYPLDTGHGDPTTLLQKMVNSYLVHNGYSDTAEVFARTTGQNLRENISSIRNRQKILNLVMSGRMGQAIEQTQLSYPGLLESNKNLCFMLKCRQFIEMINGSDLEYCPASSCAANNTTTTTTTQTPTTSCSAANQTSVIQSTKSYQNGNGSDAAATTSGGGRPSTSRENAVATDASTNTTTTMNTVAAISSNNGHSSCSSTSTSNGNSNSKGSASSASNANPANTTIPEAATAGTANAQNSSHMTVIQTDNDRKSQTILAELCSATGDAPTISKNSNENDYLNDVEMENNGHSTNGNACKNENFTSFTDSIEADEEMDVDVQPSARKYSHGIERILQFGKELSAMAQQLEKENKMTEEERQMLEDAFSLIAYSNPWASPLGWQLCRSKREAVCRALNSAILETMNYAKWPPLEYCVAHANELLKVMAQASLGACAFVSIGDVFPKN